MTGIVKTIARRIGPIRNTFYGEHWEVKYEPTPENVAYSNLPLPLHQVGILCIYRTIVGPWNECLKGGVSLYIVGFAVL